MARNRFGTPDTTRYPLADGEDWIEFKNSLTYQERMQLNASTLRIKGSEAEIDFEVFQMRRLEVWLSEWSFVDSEGQIVPISRDAVAVLDEDAGTELATLLDQHLEAMEQLKNSSTARTA